MDDFGTDQFWRICDILFSEISQTFRIWNICQITKTESALRGDLAARQTREIYPPPTHQKRIIFWFCSSTYSVLLKHLMLNFENFEILETKISKFSKFNKRPFFNAPQILMILVTDEFWRICDILFSEISPNILAMEYLKNYKNKIRPPGGSRRSAD